jgi:subtilase family serine protease
MRHPRALVVAAALALSVVAIVPAAIAAPPDDHPVPPDAAANGLAHRPVCPSLPGAQASCRSEVVTRADGATPQASTTYTSGLQPIDLYSAYKVNPTGAAASGPTVAIVDAYDNPNAAADLVVYRARFGLPLCGDGGVTSCGILTKLNQAGAVSPLPAGNTGWGQEIALDLDMASAMCPQCKILLVEGSSSSLADLGAAVNTAANGAGVVAISNSYGTSGEGSWVPSYASYYDHAGKAITVSAGDSGYGISFPDDLATVVSVGGTNLKRSTSTRGWTETVWSGTGSGCSSYVAKPTWQNAVVASNVCGKRTSSDVSAVADPNTGVAVYDSYGSSGGANWLVFGGTSVSAPIIAAMFAQVPATFASTPAPSIPYAHVGSFFDVTLGSNARNCRKSFLCAAGTGYDGPTGVGTPNGLTGL